MVKRKVLVLDLDETLIHSHHDGVYRQSVKPGTPPDFVLKVRTLLQHVSCFLSPQVVQRLVNSVQVGGEPDAVVMSKCV